MIGLDSDSKSNDISHKLNAFGMLLSKIIKTLKTLKTGLILLV